MDEAEVYRRPFHQEIPLRGPTLEDRVAALEAMLRAQTEAIADIIASVLATNESVRLLTIMMGPLVLPSNGEGDKT